MSIFNTISTAIQTATTIIPGVMQLVQVFETPDSAGKGADKKDAVVSIIKSTLDVIPDDAKAAIGGDKTIQLVSNIVDIVVKFLNAIGVFKK